MSSLSADVFDGGGKDKQSNKNKERGEKGIAASLNVFLSENLYWVSE